MGEQEPDEREMRDRLRRIEERFDAIDQRLSRLEMRFGLQHEASPTPRTARPNVPETPIARGPETVTATPAAEKPGAARPPVEATPPAAEPKRWKYVRYEPEAPAHAAQPRSEPREFNYAQLEERLTGRLMAWVGGLALIVGAIFFLSLAFSRGWIGPTARVTIGLIGGALLVVAGAWFFERRERLFGQVLTPVGLGILSLSFWAGTHLYALFPVEIGLAGALASAVAAAIIAIRANSQLIAAYGLVTAVSAPIVLSAPPSASTIAFLSAALVGTTIVALYRAWRWLPAVAFVLAAPQVVDYVGGDVAIAAAITALAAFWLLNAVAAGGEEFRQPAGQLSITSTTLLVANAVFLVANGFYVLQGDAEWGRGPFLVAVAAAHLLLGGYFLLRRGDHHPFGMLAFGTGIAAASMALPVQLGGPPVPIGWAAEAAALAWLFGYRKHGYAGLMSLALGALAIGHLMLFEYPLDRLTEPASSSWPFITSAGGTLAFIIGALAISIFVVRRWLIVIPAMAVGGLLVVYALPFETSGLLLVGLWCALFVLGVGVDQRLLQSRLSPVEDSAYAMLRRVALNSVLYAGLASGVAALLHVMAFELPSSEVGNATLPATPFWDKGTAAAVMLIVALLAAGFLAGRARPLHAATAGAFAVAAYLLHFELHPAALVVGWSLLAILALAIARFDRRAAELYGAIGGALVVLGVLETSSSVAPLERLLVRSTSSVDHPLFWSGATAAIGSIVVVLVVLAITFPSRRIEPYVWILAALGFVYLLSVGVVDDFQRRVGGATALEELQKQAQVALSILWAVLGGMGLAIGLWRNTALLRGAGLALLAVVTVKVFVYDLSSLDAAYRVLSFFGLGALLLISAYLYRHMGPHGRHPTAA